MEEYVIKISFSIAGVTSEKAVRLSKESIISKEHLKEHVSGIMDVWKDRINEQIDNRYLDKQV